MSYSSKWLANTSASGYGTHHQTPSESPALSASNTTHGPPGTTSLPEPTHWYCHKCGYGPMLRELYVVCMKCEHRGCNECTGATLSSCAEPTYTGSQPTRESSTQGEEVYRCTPSEDPLKANVTVGGSHPLAPFGPSGYMAPPGTPYYYWYCCRCGDGPYLVANNAACHTNTCQHPRCGNCKVCLSYV